MRTIEGSVIVGEHGEVKLDLPTDLIPGTHRIVVEVVEQDKEVEKAKEYPPVPTQFFGKYTPPANSQPIPGTIRRSREEAWNQLKKIFSPEELADIGKTSWDKIDFGPKTVTEIISELREDRL